MALTVTTFAAGKLQSQFRDHGSRDPLGKVVGALTDGPTLAIGRSLDSGSRFWTGVFNSGKIVEENKALKARQQAFELAEEREAGLQQQLDDLRKLNKMAQVPGRTRMAAEVVSYDPHANRMTITAGSSEGVEVGQAVATPQGLLGVIQTVDGHRSQVLLLNSPSLRIGAMVNKRPPIAGLARGMGSDRMLLGFLEGASTAIGPGDQVVTSIHSEHIPPYIRIGEVIRLQTQPEYGLVEVQVLLAVQPSEVRVVVVYK